MHPDLPALYNQEQALKFQVSNPKEAGLFQASKWLSYRVLLDEDEMEDLFAYLPLCELYNVSEIIDPSRPLFSKEQFLKEYSSYIRALKKGEGYPLNKPLFSAALSATHETFYAMEIPQKGIILKIQKPVIQLSLHHFIYSPLNNSFHFMVCSQESVSWGVQFSYPQIYSNSKQGDIIEVLKDKGHPNTPLFLALKTWMRNHSRPTPFLIDGKRVNIEPRIGSRCFPWINEHPGLKKNNLKVAEVKT